jgi:predicted transcriptional regulator
MKLQYNFLYLCQISCYYGADVRDIILCYMLGVGVMITRYRTKDEIDALILEVANKRQMRIIRIMYETFLSHDQIKTILELLIEKEFIEYHKGDMTYKTTENGLEFLGKCKTHYLR